MRNVKGQDYLCNLNTYDLNTYELKQDLNLLYVNCQLHNT